MKKCKHEVFEACEDCGCPICVDCEMEFIPREEDCDCDCHSDE